MAAREGLHFTLTPAQSQLSDHMVDAWANFARTGKPEWPRQCALAALAERRGHPGLFAAE